MLIDIVEKTTTNNIRLTYKNAPEALTCAHTLEVVGVTGGEVMTAGHGRSKSSSHRIQGLDEL
jgi:hypothetical protein